ncbi:MAG: DUF6585 family protein, partial [Anaerolineales bacterium]
ALILGAYSAWRSRNLSASLFPSGLVLRRGRKVREIPWQEIASLRLHGSWGSLPLLESGSPRVLEIRTQQGHEIRLTRELEEFEKLVESIKAKVYPRMHRALASSFNQGQSLGFGPLTLAPAGLKYRGETTRWAQISSAYLRAGKVIISRTDGEKIRLPASKIPNADLCLQMMESVVKNQ